MVRVLRKASGEGLCGGVWVCAVREQAWGMRAVAKRSRRSGCAAPRLRFCARKSGGNRRLWKLRPRRRGARGRAASAPQGLRGDRAACQRARASPAGRKQAISALRFKVLLRGRASCKVAALAVIASSCTMRGVCEFCMLADAALRSYDVVKFELQPKRPISCSTHTEKIDIIGLLLEPSSSSDARNLLFF